jgi:hypothetical protein
MDNIKKDAFFHPSLFETTNSTNKESKSFLELQNERKTKIQDIPNLQAPSKYNITTDDDTLPATSTTSLFKNLYGETLLTKLFFSRQNINNIQNILKLLVYKETKEIIDKQSNSELLIVMRSVFLEYSAHPPLIDESMSDKRKAQLYNMYTKEVTRLNEIVANSIVPKLVSQMLQYLTYLKDASEQPYQMELPKSNSITGERRYRSATQVFTGGAL